MAFLHVNMQKLHKNKTNANSAVNAKDRLQPPSEREGDHEVVERAFFPLSSSYINKIPTNRLPGLWEILVMIIISLRTTAKMHPVSDPAALKALDQPQTRLTLLLPDLTEGKKSLLTVNSEAGAGGGVKSDLS